MLTKSGTVNERRGKPGIVQDPPNDFPGFFSEVLLKLHDFHRQFMAFQTVSRNYNAKHLMDKNL